MFDFDSLFPEDDKKRKKKTPPEEVTFEAEEINEEQPQSKKPKKAEDPFAAFEDMIDLSQFFGKTASDPRKSAGGPGNPSGPKGPKINFPSFKGRRPHGPAFWTFLILAIIVGGILVASEVWTDILWYRQSGYLRILLTEWIASGLMFIVTFIVTFLFLYLNLEVAFRKRLPASSLPARSRESYLNAQKYSWVLRFVLPAVLGVAFGILNATYWRELLLAFYGGKFNSLDPQFALDASFFVFKLPLLMLGLDLFNKLIGVALILTLALNFMWGSFQTSPKFKVINKACRIHCGVLLALVSLAIGANYYLQRFAMVYANGKPTDGAMYTAVNAIMPTKTILALIAVVIAVLFLIAAFRGGWYLPVAGIAITVVSGLVLGLGYPLLVQKFRVTPNEREFEKPFIERNIKATLEAFNMQDLEHTSYQSATTKAEPQQLRKDADSTQQIRLLDPEIISPAVRQMKQSRPYYSFPEQFNVDRYTFEKDGKKETRDTVIAVRDINLKGLDKSQRNWVNDHTVYTHGFGVVAAYGNQVTSEGLPSYWESSLSEDETGEIGKYEKRVYFSQYSPDYSIVGDAKGKTPRELNYADAKKNDAQVYTTFDGNGGPNIGSLWNKLLYAIKFRSTELFFSNQINPHSQILYDRDPAKRVAKVAPYLTLDSRVYPAVVDMDGDPKTPKRLVWIVDAYTTTNNFPYAQHINLAEATADTTTSAPAQFRVENQINYMRNSVKAVVDAYDGKITLYQWDKKDPILKAWQSIYPNQVKPMEDISGDLMSHLRYPEDIFKVQRSLLTNYHVTDPSQFYTGGDQWKLSEDPTASSRGLEGSSKMQPPYYLTMKMPEQEQAQFSLTSVFIPGGDGKRAAMAGFLAVDSETGNQKGKVREEYGKLRLISLPSDTTVPGPGQVQNTFNSDPTVNKELNLQDQQGSKVIRGNLLTLPVGGGLLYVQPVYVQSTGTTQFPQLRSVLVAFGDKIGFASNLKDALDQVFGGDSGAVTAGSDTEAASSKDTQSHKESTDKPVAKTSSNANSPELEAALKEAKAALDEANQAMRQGNWAEYGKAQEKLNKALEKALANQ